MIIEVENKKVFASDAGQSFDKNKETIVLLHGSGQSHVVWSLIEQFLSTEGYNVLTIDLPGHGNSEGESLKSIENMAEWLDKVLIKIGVNKLSIIGHSQGCLIALEYCFKFQKKIKKLVFAAGGDIYMILIFGALASLVLGVGMTVSACYIFLAIVLAPAIIEAGVTPIAAHLYVLYWGVLSFITPPVAIAAITASTISKSSALETGVLSMRLGSILFFLPILFVFDPAMLMNGSAFDITISP